MQVVGLWPSLTDDVHSVCRTLAHLLRFFAHLVLVLRLMDQPLPSFAANRVLEAYVKVLEANDQVRVERCSDFCRGPS